MTYALFSDVHANFEAFSAVLEALKKEDLDGYFFLGDIVGYGADPKRCLDLLRELIEDQGCQALAGNHDHAVCELTDTQFYNKFAKASIEWTKTQLDQESLAFLARLPLSVEHQHFTAVHANLIAPQSWGYVLDVDDAQDNFNVLNRPVCFIGHSHRPAAFIQSKGIEIVTPQKIRIHEGQKMIVNVGSVGQPRDGNPRACYALLNVEERTIEIRRVAYDIQGAQRKIIEAGLPKELAERLSVGK